MHKSRMKIYINDSDCGYMFRLVLATLLHNSSDCDYMFRMVVAIL